MIRGMYTAASGIITCQATQDIISNNFANVNTTGYKSQIISVKSFDEVYIANKDGKNNKKNTIGTMSNGVEFNKLVTNFEQGSINKTGVKTDFALQGEGFFVVQRQTGGGTTNYYTRDGHFVVDGAGYLVTTSGDRVLSNEGGALRPIYVGNGTISASPDGSLQVNGQAAGKLAVATFPKNEDGEYNGLTEFAYNLFEGQNPQIINYPRVVHESLEGSNVNVVEETNNMMSVMRRFESNTTVLKTLDATLEKAVNKLGTV